MEKNGTFTLCDRDDFPDEALDKAIEQWNDNNDTRPVVVFRGKTYTFDFTHPQSDVRVLEHILDRALSPLVDRQPASGRT